MKPGRRRTGLRRLATLAACLLAGAASAQTVYRCGSEYRASPCPGGDAVPVQDDRTETQRSEAARAAQADKRAASQLERERRARESAAGGAPIGGFYTLPRPVAQPASAPARPKAKAGDKPVKKKPRRPSERSRA